MKLTCEICGTEVNCTSDAVGGQSHCPNGCCNFLWSVDGKMSERLGNTIRNWTWAETEEARKVRTAERRQQIAEMKVARERKDADG